MNPNKQITLYYREGSSDKVYQAAIEPSNGGFVVNFAYGRRGSALQTGTKTQTPVPYQEAQKICEKLIRSKTAKGYTPIEDGAPFTHPEQSGQVSGIQCQLLNAVDEEDAENLVKDTIHWMQEKHDGRRLLIQKTGQAITGINRKGLVVGLFFSIEKSAQASSHDFIVDSEAVGDVLHAFDLLSLDGQDLRYQPYKERHFALGNLLSSIQQGHIEIVDTWGEPEQKSRWLQTLREENKEGVVFKRWDAPYEAGRPASGGSQLKLKFTATASFIVVGTNRQRSVALGLHSDGATSLVDAGNVTIPSNRKVPPLGRVVEVRYLYAFKESGKVYQPYYLGERDDVDDKNCTMAQLKYRAPVEEDPS